MIAIGPRVHTVLLLSGLLTAVTAGTALADDAVDPTVDAAALEFFETRVRPLLVAKCVSCHGPQKQHAGLRLDSRPALLAGGDSGSALDLDALDESLLLSAVRRESFEMPPDEPLSADEVAILSEWGRQGAVWPKQDSPETSGDSDVQNHWAWQPIDRPEPPLVNQTAWVRNDIDRFVLARLEQENIVPGPAADRATLLRRMKWDLTGLPVSSDEQQEFRKASAEDLDRWIEQQLQSPHYGERAARYWLDVARYSDTKGYAFFEKRDFRVAWTYRDYVIRSFNEDKAFPQFVREQIAADLLPDVAYPDQAALGFITVGPRFKNDPHEIIADRIDVVFRGFMGITAGCARCHDHKYDPITIDDYYSLYGVFQNSLEPLHLPFLAGEERGQQDGPAKQVREAAEALEQHYRQKYEEVLADGWERLPEYLQAAQTNRSGASTAVFDVVQSTGDVNPELVLFWEQYLTDSETSEDPVFRPWHQLAQLASAEFAKQAPAVLQNTTDSSNARVLQQLQASPLSSFADVVARYATLLKQLRQKHDNNESLSTDESAVLQVVAGERSPLQAPFHRFRLLRLFPDRASQKKVNELNKTLDDLRAKASVEDTQILALRDADTMIVSRVLRRGDPARPQQEVPRRFPRFFQQVSSEPWTSGSGRRELADAIVSPQNPLTARVLVNRIWQQHFGRGLVTTPDNFGVQTPEPVHAALLDHLSSWLIDHDWSVKALHRYIMQSATYRQSSHSRPELQSSDPDNNLLARMNRRRQDFETMRDALLAVRGDLDPTVGGPSVGSSLATDNRRRTLYARIDRLNVPGTMRTFDFPSPDVSRGARDATTVPGQALFLMNHPLVLSTAKAVAERAASQATAPQQITALYREVLQRTPTADEAELFRTFLNTPADEVSEDVSEDTSLSPLQRAAQVLLLSNEFHFVD